jgi:hypothetical protein
MLDARALRFSCISNESTILALFQAVKSIARFSGKCAQQALIEGIVRLFLNGASLRNFADGQTLLLNHGQNHRRESRASSTFSISNNKFLFF